MREASLSVCGDLVVRFLGIVITQRPCSIHDMRDCPLASSHQLDDRASESSPSSSSDMAVSLAGGHTLHIQLCVCDFSMASDVPRELEDLTVSCLKSKGG